MIHKYDYLVIGSGIAGMSFALKVAEKGKSVAIICKTELEEANTYFAQGGIASVTNLQVDNFEKHIHDTMVAGDWINDRAAVEMVVRRAPSQIEELIRWGVEFDKNESGEFDLHREGGHSEFRILHHKDNMEQKYRPASSEPSRAIRTYTSSTITSPSKSSPSTTWALSSHATRPAYAASEHTCSTKTPDTSTPSSHASP